MNRQLAVSGEVFGRCTSLHAEATLHIGGQTVMSCRLSYRYALIVARPDCQFFHFCAYTHRHHRISRVVQKACRVIERTVSLGRISMRTVLRL